MTHLENGQIKAPADARRFVLAFHEKKVTIRSRKTGARFTYRIAPPENNQNPNQGSVPPLFVSVLTGENNESDYSFFGTVFDATFAPRFHYSNRKARIAYEAPSVTAFRFLWRCVVEENRLPENLEVWHEGRCCKCGRPLTDPQSIASGIGPVCAEKA